MADSKKLLSPAAHMQHLFLLLETAWTSPGEMGVSIVVVAKHGNLLRISASFFSPFSTNNKKGHDAWAFQKAAYL